MFCLRPSIGLLLIITIIQCVVLHRLNVITNLLTGRVTTTVEPPVVDDNTRHSHRYQSNVTKTIEKYYSVHDNVATVNTDHDDCYWRHKFPSLVGSIYVYPSPTNKDPNNNSNNDDNDDDNDFSSLYPWEIIDERSKRLKVGPYDPNSPLMQYNTELLVRDLFLHPRSKCLLTDNPADAKLFYVPYLPATEWHNGTQMMGEYKTSNYGQAIRNILERQDYNQWETVWNQPSTWWKRRDGADHILVFSEPMHGLWHPRTKRGNYHYLQSQYQTHPPIIISVELSTTFVQMYPNCASKNILLPYPNTDGRWYNGKIRKQNILTTSHSSSHHNTTKETLQTAALASELDHHRIFGQYYKGGNHGTCTALRRALASDFRCTSSGRLLQQIENNNIDNIKTSTTKSSKSISSQPKSKSKKFTINDNGLFYSQSTFCPCPGGDSPSAKRMFDAILAGCIPVILSHDFVWPFSTEIEHGSGGGGGGDAPGSGGSIIDPNEFSLRLDASAFQVPKFDDECERMSTRTNNDDLQSILESISPERIQSLKAGVEKASQLFYNWYEFSDDVPDNPMLQGVLPTGGVAHSLLRSLTDRVNGRLWDACRREVINITMTASVQTSKMVKNPVPTVGSFDQVKQFKC